jgi:hypothetical protein
MAAECTWAPRNAGYHRPMSETLSVHLLEETARHAGHADILGELIDGRAGD